MYEADDSILYVPQDVRLCGVCKQWVELGEFRRRTGGGIAHECRECHNQQRAAQARRQRARRRHKTFQSGIADVNCAITVPELHGAARALLGVCGGVNGLARTYAQQFNAAAPGSQMRCSMLLAAMKVVMQYAAETEQADPIEDMSDDELRDIIVKSLGSP